MKWNAVYRFLVALLLIVGMTGCGTLSSTVSHSSGQDVAVSQADHQLTLDVLNRLHNDAVAGIRNFGVVSRDGDVTVFGVVANEGMRRRVISIVEGTPGVVRVNDRLSR